MAEPCDVGTEAREDGTFLVAGLRLPRCALFTPESAARALALRPLPHDVVLSSYPRCDSPCVDAIVWSLLYPDLPLPRPLPCLEMVGGDLSQEHRLPRLIKTYLPFRLVPFYRRSRYIYVLRAPWDACAALHDFLCALGQGAPFDAFFADFLEGSVPYGSYFRHVSAWHRKSGEPNVLLLCREHVEHNPRSALYQIAAFLGEPYLSRLLDPEGTLEDRLLGQISDEAERGTRLPPTPRRSSSFGLEGWPGVEEEEEEDRGRLSESQLNEILAKVTQQFGHSSLEFLWFSLFQKQLSVLLG